jgi:hypothetical protein
MHLLRERSRLSCTTGILVICAGLTFAQARGQDSPAAVGASGTSPKMLTVIPYTYAGAARALTLWREEIEPLQGTELLAYFKDNPNETNFPNTAFYVVDCDAGDLSKGRLAWITYAYHNKLIRPQQTWSADLAWYSGSPEAYVALSKSISWNVTLSIFKIDSKEQIATFPFTLDAADYRKWPKASQPVSKLERKLYDQNISGISAIKLIAQADHLLIYGQREHESSRAVWFRFELPSKEWAELTLKRTTEPEGLEGKQK